MAVPEGFKSSENREPLRKDPFNDELEKIAANPSEAAAYTRKYLQRNSIPASQFLANFNRLGISLKSEDLEKNDIDHDRNLAVAVAKIQHSLGGLETDGKFGRLTNTGVNAHLAAKEVAAVNAEVRLEELQGVSRPKVAPNTLNYSRTLIVKNALSSTMLPSQVAIVGDSIADQLVPHIKGVPKNQVDAVVGRRMVRPAMNKSSKLRIADHGNILDAAEAMLAKLKPGDLMIWDGAINDADQVRSDAGAELLTKRLIDAHLGLIEKAHALGIRTAILLPHPPLVGHKDPAQQGRIEKVMALVGDELRNSNADVIIDPTPLLLIKGISTRDGVHLNAKGVKTVSTAVNSALFG